MSTAEQGDPPTTEEIHEEEDEESIIPTGRILSPTLVGEESLTGDEQTVLEQPYGYETIGNRLSAHGNEDE